MKPIFTVLALITTIFYASISRANTFTMQEAVDSALAANPDISAASHEAEAQQARPPQAATPPDPMFMVDFIGVPTNTSDVSQGTVQYMVEQQVPFPSKLVYGYKAEKRQAEATQSAAQVTTQELIRQTKRSYIDTWRLKEEERIHKKTVSMYLESKGSAETAYATTKGNLADPVRASVEMGDIEGQLALVEQEKLASIATLSKLTAKPIDSSVNTEPPNIAQPIATLTDLINRAKTTRPEISEASHMIESQTAKRSLAKAQFGPDFVLRWGFMDNPSGLPNAWYGRAGVSVPLWSLSKQRFGVREAEAMLKRAKSVKEAAELSTEEDIRSTYARLMGAKKVLDVYAKNVVPRAQILISSSREAYKSSKGDFLGLVDSIRSLSNAEITLIRAKADVAKAYADLERAVGGPPTPDGG